MNVKLLMLSTGQEVIARLEKESELAYVLSDVMVLSIVQTQGGTQVSMFPWMLGFPKGEIEVKKIDIVGKPLESEG